MRQSTYDPKAGAAAFTALHSTLLQIPSAAVATPRVDVQDAAVGALTIVPFLLEPTTKAEFATLPKTVFDASMLGVLEQAALAAWYAQTEMLSESAASDEQRVPTATVQAASTLRARMQKLLEYFFSDDAAIAAELASIRSGAGYQDLATDLTRLAKLYDAEKTTIERDVKHYQADDAAKARKAAEQILIALVDSANASRGWQDMRNRAWTYLQNVYGEVCAAGAFLYRGTEDAARFERSLVSSGRTRRRRGAETSDPVATPAPAPVANPAPSEASGAAAGAGVGGAAADGSVDRAS